MPEVDESVYLRMITYEDTDVVLSWRNSEEVKKYFIFQNVITRETHMNWLKNKVWTGEVVQFIVVERSTGDIIGSTYIQNIDKVHKNAEYGIFMDPTKAVGRGLGTAAAKLTIKYAFENMKLHKLYLRVLADNNRAKHSYEKAGFKLEGILIDEVIVNGTYRDISRMAIVNAEQKNK